MLLETIAVLVSFTNPDPSLERFELEQPVAATGQSDVQALEMDAGGTESDTQPEPSWLWRSMGYLNYLAGGTSVGAGFYRQSRTTGWEPAIGNDYARVATMGATVEGLNYTSDRLYRSGMRAQAWMLRLGSIALFATNATINFDRGWSRE